jgi:hypothetical protein
MPELVRSMFPAIISATGNIIEMEKIRGINYSYLYTHGGLQEGEIDLLLTALKKIHESSQNEEKIDYHQNYGDKMSRRYFDNLDFKINLETKNFISKLRYMKNNLKFLLEDNNHRSKSTQKWAEESEFLDDSPKPLLTGIRKIIENSKFQG